MWKSKRSPWAPTRSPSHLLSRTTWSHVWPVTDGLIFWVPRTIYLHFGSVFSVWSPIFGSIGQRDIDLARTLPIYSHGDEGRGKKRKALLVWSIRCCIGEGTQLFQERYDETERAERLGINMGASLATRFLRATLPKALYGKVAKPVWDDLGRHIGSSYRRLQEEGFWFAVVCLGLTGDNPFLAKCGNFERSFARVPKETCRSKRSR